MILMFPFLYGKVLHPQGNVVGESLDIQGKIRAYHLLDNNSYTVSGPSIVSIYARLAVPKNEKGVHPFLIKSFLSDAPESIHQFHKKVDYSVTSSLHPMHRYTKSAKVEIEIPTGEFILLVENGSNTRKPILTRVIQKRRKK
ncbi:MAG: hypothetical protein HOA66_00185 [Candidatus Marinimicrobia bacterium]|nr:hypothetical protein [Candidatus Neomarinimicrobiota bacterium]